MKRHCFLYLLACATVAGALSAKSAETPIPYLPYTISAPGTYVLKGNLTCPAMDNMSAITINSPSSGNTDPEVIVDLKGFTITGTISAGSTAPATTGVTINSYPVTIRNGSFVNFAQGVVVYTYPEAKDITINKVTFNLYPSNPNIIFSPGLGTGVNFYGVADSKVSNCNFENAATAILSTGDLGGNVFSDCWVAESVGEALSVAPLYPYVEHGLKTAITITRFATAPDPTILPPGPTAPPTR
jgi:hypothetical protein